MGKTRPDLAHIRGAHLSGNSLPPHGWCRKGKTRSAPRQTPRRKKSGNSPTPHGWNPMGRTRCVPAPFAAPWQCLWEAVTRTAQRAATFWAILHGAIIRKAADRGFSMALLWRGRVDQTLSSTVAMPCPTPIHMVAKARFSLRSCVSFEPPRFCRRLFCLSYAAVAG
jgi:hypothetical protein